MNGGNVPDIVRSVKGHQLGGAIDTGKDQISSLDIKPDRIGCSGRVGFREVASVCSVKCGLRETLRGCRALIVAGCRNNRSTEAN